MRWSYLIPRAVLLLIFWAFFAFAFDPLLHRATISAGQEAIGARLEMAELETAFFPPALAAREVRIANRFSPDKNLVEFDELRFELEGQPLMRRAFIVREGRITGLKWSTERSDSGAVDGSLFEGLGRMLQLDGLGAGAAELGQDALEQLISQAGLQLDPQQLETVRVADELQRQWTGRFESYEQRVGAFEQRAKRIEGGVRKVEGNALEKLQHYSRAAAEVEQLLAEAQQIRNELARLPQTARSDFQQLDAARLRDQRMIATRLRVLSLDPEVLSEALLGRELADRLEQHVAWMRVLQQYAAIGFDAPEPERLRGDDIHFVTGHELPRYLVRSLSVSGEAELNGELLPFEANVTGLTSDPKLYGHPVIVQATATGEAQIELDASLDHTGETPVRQFAMSYTLPQPLTVELGDPHGVGVTVKAQSLNTRAILKMEGEQLAGVMTLSHDPVVLRTSGGEELNPNLRRMLDSALQGVRRIEATVSLAGTIDEPSLSLRSDLGPQLSAGLNRVLTAELETHRRELLAQLDAAAQQRTNELQQLMQERYQGVLAQLDLNEGQAKSLIQRFAGQPTDLQRLFRR